MDEKDKEIARLNGLLKFKDNQLAMANQVIQGQCDHFAKVEARRLRWMFWRRK